VVESAETVIEALGLTGHAIFRETAHERPGDYFSIAEFIEETTLLKHVEQSILSIGVR